MTESSNDKQNKPRSWIERLTNLLGHEPKTQEQLMEVLHDAKERDILSHEMLGMIERILQVSEMQVREVMIPKSQMVVIPRNSKLEDILTIVRQSGHSRFPVIENGKNVVGILHAKDLLKFFHLAEQPFNINDILRTPVPTSQSKRLDILLREFRVNRNHLAIVLDEYGHVAGLVTIEDVLEQIVGEIEDEFDIKKNDGQIKKLEDGSYIVKAATRIEEFNEYFQGHFSDEEFDTIGGIVMQNFGYLPKRGEIIKISNFRFKVLQCDNRRIYLLEVKKLKKK